MGCGASLEVAEVASLVTNVARVAGDQEEEVRGCNYVVFGAGSAEVNGLYVRDGEHGGSPLFKNDKWWLMHYTVPGGKRFWYIADKDNVDVDAGDMYCVPSDAAEPPTHSAWLKAPDGILPVPTLLKAQTRSDQEESQPKASVQKASSSSVAPPPVSRTRRADPSVYTRDEVASSIHRQAPTQKRLQLMAPDLAVLHGTNWLFNPAAPLDPALVAKLAEVIRSTHSNLRHSSATHSLELTFLA